MKARSSFFLLGPMLLMSVAVSGQQWNQTPRNAPNSHWEDPFEIMRLEMESMDNQRPFDNHAPARRQDTEAATVSLQQLQHKVPKPAYKEFKKGSEAARKGHDEAAIEHLQNAIKIDAEFADAHNDLGVMYVRAGQLGTGEIEFQKATVLVPYHNTAVANLAITLFVLGRYHEACPVARRALKIDPTYPYLFYVLGFSIIAEHGDKTEALDNLERAAQKFPEARLVASKILAQMGRRDDAARQLREYLRSAPKEDARREQVEAQLAQLRQ